ncbi:hypothetical protein [Rahnella variigena]|jgi:hypothetical protein|uniref:hypothetical protein n=1 Tax=Rahnella variigena TaxID=574964 RepID=UPI000DE9062E|nr:MULTISPECIES: hypothetical protein [Rahnella]RBQ33669.1 hypothetical protein C2125_13455 [Rahnella aquatilis]
MSENKLKLVQCRIPVSLDEKLKQLDLNVSEEIRKALNWSVYKNLSLESGLNVSVTYSPREPRDKFRQEEYLIYAKIEGLTAGLLEETINFLLPEFNSENVEPMRIYPIAQYRAIFPGCRSQTNNRLLGTKVVNLEWNAVLIFMDSELAEDPETLLELVCRRIEEAISKAAFDQLYINMKEMRVSDKGELEEGIFKRYQNCVINYNRPENYEAGAWQLEIVLSQEAMENDDLIGDYFFIPKLPNRLILVDGQYARAAMNPETNEYEITMQFINGKSKAHVYTNGISENENPTSLKEVCDAISRSITKSTRV